MADRLNKIDDGFLRVETTEHLDSIPLPGVSTPPSNKMAVMNAAPGNESGGPAVLRAPKLMTPVGCLNEICVVRKLSIPKYEAKGEVGVAHMKIFTMGVHVRDMELRETGYGRTKMEAKHEAATRILDKIRSAGERHENLNRVNAEVVKKCHEMLKKFVLTEPQSQAEAEITRISAGKLRVYEKDHGMTPSVYDCVDVSGPPHNRSFTMTCKQGDHITRGTAKSKQFAKNIAASHMLKILSDSSQQVNPQQEQQ